VKRVQLDTNVVLRFLLKDHEKLFAQAESLFREASAGRIQLLIRPVIVAETFFVLTSFYEIPRPEAAKVLHTFFEAAGISVDDEGGSLEALKRITSNKVSFADAYLIATAAQTGDTVASFDRGIHKAVDVQHYAFEE